MSVDFLRLASLSVPAVVATAAIAEQAAGQRRSVTPRATEGVSVNPQNANRHAARGAPAPSWLTSDVRQTFP